MKQLLLVCIFCLCGICWNYPDVVIEHPKAHWELLLDEERAVKGW